MFQEITYFPIFGKPFIMYLGIAVLSCFLITAFIGYGNFKGKNWVSFKWHPRVAGLSIALALIHAFLGVTLYF